MSPTGGGVVPSRHVVSSTSAGATTTTTPSLADIFLGLDGVRQVAGLVLMVIWLVLAHTSSWEIILRQAGAWLVVRMYS